MVKRVLEVNLGGLENASRYLGGSSDVVGAPTFLSVLTVENEQAGRIAVAATGAGQKRRSTSRRVARR